MDMRNGDFHQGLEDITSVHNNVDRRNLVLKTINEKLQLDQNKKDLADDSTVDTTDGLTIDTINKARKKKADFRLYPLYQAIMKMVNEMMPTLNELIVKEQNEEGETVYNRTETAICFSNISTRNETLVQSIIETWIDLDGKPEELRKGFIKDKVNQTRYTKKGYEYALKFDELNDLCFSLSSLIVDFQLTLNDLIKNHPEVQTNA